MNNLKKVLGIAVSSIAIFAIYSNTDVFAATKDTATLYTNITKSSVTSLNTNDEVYISSKNDLEDKDFYSSIFPENLNAKLKVTTGLESAEYGSEKYGNGYGVNVLQKDTQFDSCTSGHFFLDALNSNWRYYCNAGGAQNCGPYYIYKVDTTTFSADNIEITQLKNISDINDVKLDKTYFKVEAKIGDKTYIIDDYNFVNDVVNYNKGKKLVTIKVGDKYSNLSKDFNVNMEGAQGNTWEDTNLTLSKKDDFEENDIEKAKTAINEYDKLSDIEKKYVDESVINNLKNKVKVYEEKKNAKVNAEDFITNYLVDLEKNMYKESTKDNYKKILSGKSEWDKLSTYAKDLINSKLVENGGVTYEKLLEKAAEIQKKLNEVPKTGDKSNIIGCVAIIILATSTIIGVKKFSKNK